MRVFARWRGTRSRLPHVTGTAETRRSPALDLWPVLIIGVAALLRLAFLGRIPTFLEYDEAANVILAGEIARGVKLPIFIRPYTGKEALYFYAAAAVMRLGGISVFSLRLTSATCGLITVALTLFCARELAKIGGVAQREQRWLALFSAGLVAVSYWQVNLARLGYRAVILPPLLAATVGLLLRGLRTGWRRLILLAGASAGLCAYTYSSVRVLPLFPAAIWLWVGIADRRQWRERLLQFVLFGLAAGLVFAPLGVFFLRYPETFWVRLSQVSILNPSVHQGDLWGTLWRTTRLALGMFATAGDMNPLYNAPGKPVFGRLIVAFFYLGLGLAAWRMVPSADRAWSRPNASPSVETLFPRLPSFVLLCWLAVMMIPNVLSASGVPHNLRAMALVPALFILSARGIVAPIEWLHARAAAQGLSEAMRRVGRWLQPSILILLLGGEGARTGQAYLQWARSAPPYYKGNQALLRAAALIDAYPESDPYVATYFHQHATLAVSSARYGQIRWISGSTLVLPPPNSAPALLIYDHTNPVDPLLRERYLAPESLLLREFGPDGGLGFEAFQIEAASRPGPAPQFPMQANVGHTLTLLGYDLNGAAQSGDELDVTLYWEVQRPVDRDDWAFFAHLVDDAGFRWGEDTFFVYPSAQWRPGEVLIARRRFEVAPGAPPGSYTLHVGAFSSSLDARLPVLNASGQMAGTTHLLGPIAISPADAPPAELPPIQQPLQVAVGEQLVFLGSDRDRSDLRPGETLALTLYWQARGRLSQPADVLVSLDDSQGSLSLWRGPPVRGSYPFMDWQRGEFIRDRYALRLPLDTPAGDYELSVTVVDAEGVPMALASGGESISLGTIHVHETDRLWEPPAFAYPVGARLGNEVELLGYDLERSLVQLGESLQLALVWQCREAMDVAYTVFTHLLDENQQVRGQKDNPPVHGTYPTTLWVPGEIVVDRYQIPVDPDAAPGQYVIEVGLYDPGTMQRLAVQDPTGAIGDRVLLADVEIARSR